MQCPLWVCNLPTLIFHSHHVFRITLGNLAYLAGVGTAERFIVMPCDYITDHQYVGCFQQLIYGLKNYQLWPPVMVTKSWVTAPYSSAWQTVSYVNSLTLPSWYTVCKLQGVPWVVSDIFWVTRPDISLGEVHFHARWSSVPQSFNWLFIYWLITK